MSFGELLIAPQVWPFSLALFLFFVVVILEVAAVLVGFGADLGVDLSLDVDLPEPSAYGRFLDWLGIGRVPYLISIAAFLLGFGIIGLFVQTAQIELFQVALFWPIVAVGASAATLPLVRFLNLALGKIWPKDVETSAVSQDSLIGHEAVVVLGRVTATEPGQIKVRDSNGTTHYALAVADNADEVFDQGAHLLIVSRRGATYVVITHPNPVPSPSAN